MVWIVLRNTRTRLYIQWARVNARVNLGMKKNTNEGERKNHSTQDSRVVPHRGTNWAAPWLTSQIGRDAVLSRSYGRGYSL